MLGGGSAHSEWTVGLVVSAVTHASTWLVLSVVAQQHFAHLNVEQGQQSVEINLSAAISSEPTAAANVQLTSEAAAIAERTLPVELQASSLQTPRTPAEVPRDTAAVDAELAEQLASPPLARKPPMPVTEQIATEDAKATQPSVARQRSVASPSLTTQADMGAPFDKPPQAQITNEPPTYPSEALEQGVAGTVVLRVLVNADGGVDAVSVELSSGVKLLDDTALEKVQQWRFVPASLLGVRVEAEVRVPIVFRLETSESSE